MKVNLRNLFEYASRASVDGYEVEGVYFEAKGSGFTLDLADETQIEASNQQIEVTSGSNAVKFMACDGEEHTAEFWTETQSDLETLHSIGEAGKRT